MAPDKLTMTSCCPACARRLRWARLRSIVDMRLPCDMTLTLRHILRGVTQKVPYLVNRVRSGRFRRVADWLLASPGAAAEKLRGGIGATRLRVAPRATPSEAITEVASIRGMSVWPRVGRGRGVAG